MEQELWKELMRVALTGTGQSRIGEGSRRQLAALGVTDGQPEPEVVLDGLARLTRRRRAGFRPRRRETMPAGAPEEENLLPCGPRSSEHLELILEGPFAEALPEFVRLLRAHGRCLPPERLPELLDRCRQEPALWPDLQPALGRRGAWLMAQNPYWRDLQPPPAPPDGPGASLESRLAQARQLRREEPAAAVASLQALWPDLRWRQKLACLELFREGPFEADEPFLEAALEDGRKEVRLAAAALLAQRPDSALVRRAISWARELVRPAEGGHLRVDLPGEPDAAMRRDALPDLAVGKGRSLRRNRLVELLRRVPPTSWEDWLADDPAGCLARFARAEYAADSLEALTEAVYRFQAEAWMQPLFTLWTRSADRSLWQQAVAQRLMRAYPQAIFEALAEGALERSGPLVEEDSPLGQLLLLGAHDWPDALTLRLVEGFRQWLGDRQQFYWNTWHYKQLWQVAAYRASPQLFDRLREGWPTQGRQWPAWSKDMERMLRTLLFRRDMHRALERQPPEHEEK